MESKLILAHATLTEQTFTIGQPLYCASLEAPHCYCRNVSIVVDDGKWLMLENGKRVHKSNLQGEDSGEQYYLSPQAFADELVRTVGVLRKCYKSWLGSLFDEYGSPETIPASDLVALQSAYSATHPVLEYAALHRAGKKIAAWRQPSAARR